MDGWHMLIKLNEWNREAVWTLLGYSVILAVWPRFLGISLVVIITIFLLTNR
jgi:hypothetical protein